MTNVLKRMYSVLRQREELWELVFYHKWCSKFCQRRIIFLNELKQLMAQE